MALQMKMPLKQGTSRQELLKLYQAYLQADVSDFSAAERDFILPIIQQATDYCFTLVPDLLPNKIELIKTNGRHYGPGVFYTRENRIIIPQNELLKQDHDQMLQVMMHELFHLISRQHPDLRKALYTLIGFNRLSKEQAYIIPDSMLKSRLLLNPDGVVRDYAITLAIGLKDTVQAIPLLQSISNTYQPHLPDYFNYMDFGLYPLQKKEGVWQLQSKPLPSEQMTDFYRQIGDNTNYIIHPDEILAENFTLLVLRANGKLNANAQRLSPEGQLLLQRLAKCLAHFSKSGKSGFQQ